MGTRAIISLKGELILATHWDGHLSSLGKQLLAAGRDIPAIIEVAKKHQIDFARTDILPEIAPARLEEILQRQNKIAARAKLPPLTPDDIRAGTRVCPAIAVIASSDYEIDDITGYDDWAEYQYDYQDGKILVRELSGSWTKTEPGEWVELGDAISREASK